MGAAPSEYDAVIADLENQILELQGTVETLKRLRDKGPVSGEATPLPPRRTPVLRAAPEGEPEFPSDFFMKMSLPDAVKAYLSMVKRKQSTKQIMDALARGGYPHRSKKFYNTVFGVLNRHWKTVGEIVKVDGDWGLAEWYRSLPGESRKPAEDRLRKLFPSAAEEDKPKDPA